MRPILKFWISFAALAAFALYIASMCGCAEAIPDPVQHVTPAQQVQTNLHNIQTELGVVNTAGILGVIASIAMAFTSLSAFSRILAPIAGSAVAVGTTGLILLPYAKIIVLIGGIILAICAAYEIDLKVTGNPKKLPDLLGGKL